jgi:predicted ATPase/DNA-binding NarL/FixJ family response regulator
MTSPAQPLDPLIGRDAEVAQLVEMVRSSRLITLTGVGGSGKSRLAAAVIDALSATGHTAKFVDCSAALASPVVLTTLAAALEVGADAGADSEDAVIRVLAASPTVLGVDNLEQVDGAGRLLVGLLEAAETLRIIATSRRPLGVRGEVEFAVRPLPLPQGRTRAAVEASAAGALFLARAREVQPDLDLDEATATDVAILLEHLDGLPLAIELAAARTRAASPGEILQRLESRGIDAIEGEPGDEHRSLGVILDWTLLQLPQRDVAVLQGVAVCAGFDLEFVDALVPGGRGIESIEALLALGLVQRAGTIGGVSRFRLLETIRTNVLRQMDADRLTEARRRHADHVLDLAGRWEGAAEGASLREIAPQFDADADNVRRALDWLESDDPRRALELLSKLVPFWKLHARAAEGFARFRAAEAASPEASVERARAAACQLQDAWLFLSAAEFSTLVRETLDLARSVDDRTALLNALRESAHLAYQEGNVQALAAAAGELKGMSNGSPEAALVDAQVRAIESALVDGRTSNEYVALQRAYIAQLAAPGLVVRRELARGNLAGALLGRREFGAAASLALEVADTFRGLDHRADLAWILAFLAPALAQSGRTAEAVDVVVECAQIALEGGQGENIASAMWAAIPVANAVDRPALAVTLYSALTSGMLDRGEITLNAMDADLARGWFREASRRVSPVALELALRDGAAAKPVDLVRSLPGILRTEARRAPGSVRIRHGELTRREVEVLTLVGSGATDPEIAAVLFISPKTASVHLANIKGKLGLETRVQVALRARELGMLDEQGSRPIEGS